MFKLSMPPLEIQTPHVVYDISRLCRSWNRAFATGVDRIDLAIGLNLLKTFRERCHFLHLGPFGPIMLPYSFGRRILLHLERIWNHGKSGLLSRNAALELRFYSLRPIRRLDFRAYEATYVAASHSGLGKAAGGLRRLDPHMVLERCIYLHDLIPLDMPEYQRPGTDQTFLSYLTEVIDGEVTIVANSKDTEKRIRSLAERRNWNIKAYRLGIPELKTMPHRSNASCPQVSAYLADPRPIFTVIGTIEPRKNHLLLLNIWRQLCSTYSSPPRLCIIGKRGWENENVVDMLERCHVIRGSIEEFGSLADNDVQRLLCASKALLFPSFIEGLGVPLLEAAALDVPCIVADIPVFREIAPAGTIFLDPLDGLGWKAAILEMASLT
jgi:glycosyltransferase involved in cell wall biosynthesis